jgi:hypothetical protein
LNLDVGKGSHGGGVSYERWNNVPSILTQNYLALFP